jgi:NAD(P)-dependent dehydrogenase (short-subunit alcohol dehydrogenase family)
MPKPVSEQVVVIVGASSGIGRASALAFARRGARVVCAARNVDALTDLVEEIEGSGGAAVSVPTDIADPEAVRRLADSAQDHYGGIDTWVNAAAIAVWGRVEDVSDEEFDRVIRVNFLGHVHAVHAVLPIMRTGGGGVIIGISSVEGVRSVPLQAPYTASKWALRALYDSLRVELAQEGVPIAVSTILPASIDTPFFEHARSKLGAMPKPPPPVYAPELVAAAVVRAAERPRREIPVGGAALAFFIGQRLSPALTDALMSIPRLGAGSQKSDRPDNGEDNLDEPVPGAARVHGAHPGEVLTRSPFTWAAARLPRPGELVTAAATQLQKRRSGALGRDDVRAEGVGGDTPAAMLESTASGDPDRNSDEPDRNSGEPDRDSGEVMDLDAMQSKLRGWGPNEGPELTAEQAAGLQKREEPVAAANFGEQLTGDLGNAEVADEAVDAPETVQPDTELGPRDRPDGRGDG